MTTSTTTCWG